MSGVLAIHEFWEVDQETTLLCIVIGQDSVVDEFPSKGIRYNNDDSFGGYTLWWCRNVGWQAMDCGGCADGSSTINMATEAVGTRHLWE